MIKFLSELPSSLRREEEEFDGTIIQGVELDLTNPHVLRVTPGVTSWSFGVLDFPEMKFDSREDTPREGEYLLGFSAETFLGETFTEVNDLSVSGVEGVRVSGDFLLLEDRPENLQTSSSEPWIPGFPGAELHLDSPGGFINYVKVSPAQDFIYEGVTYNGEAPVGGESVTLIFPGEDTTVERLEVSGTLKSNEEETRARSSFYLTPLDNSVGSNFYALVRDLFLVEYDAIRGFSLLRDLRVFSEANCTDVTKALVGFMDDRLNELHELPEKYVQRYMNPYLAYQEND